MRLIPSPPAMIEKGEIFFEERDLLKISEKEMRQIRGGKIYILLL
jgi:ABC-type microcin C transport system duplicated ATPase subunit YejF